MKMFKNLMKRIGGADNDVWGSVMFQVFAPYIKKVLRELRETPQVDKQNCQ